MAALCSFENIQRRIKRKITTDKLLKECTNPCKLCINALGGGGWGGGLHKCYSWFSKVGKQHLGAFILHYVLGCIWGEGWGGWADMMRLGSEVSICHSKCEIQPEGCRKHSHNFSSEAFLKHITYAHPPWRSGRCRRDKPWRLISYPGPLSRVGPTHDPEVSPHCLETEVPPLVENNFFSASVAPIQKTIQL